MAVTQIVGPRIAPLWADPVEWTSTRTYEPFTFVTYQGDSYCSRQDTPIGIEITNDDYWVKVSEYNAQAVALQRSMTQTIETAETNMSDTIQTAENSMTSTINTAESNMAEQVSAVESVKNEFQNSLDAINAVVPLDSTPTENSTKGVTSGGVYNAIKTETTKYLMLFGDSFTGEGFGEGEKWYVRVAKYLNLNVLNYAISGYAFGTEFEEELTNAKNSVSETVRQNITTCIIYGGINNIMAAQQNFYDFSSLVIDFVKDVIEWLPNAKIYVAAPNSGSMLLERQTVNIAHTAVDSYAYLKNSLQALGVVYVFPFYWLYGGDYFVSDMLHTNAMGNKIIANQMIETICGTKNLCSNLLFYSAENGVWTPQLVGSGLGNAANATIERTVGRADGTVDTESFMFSNGIYTFDLINADNFAILGTENTYGELQYTFHTNATLSLKSFDWYSYDTSYYVTASIKDEHILVIDIYHSGGSYQAGSLLANARAVICITNADYALQ